jgi:phosphoglucomutase
VEEKSPRSIEPKVYQWCRDHKDKITSAANDGDTDAQNIITAHQMLVRYPDHMALGLLMAAAHAFADVYGLECEID